MTRSTPRELARQIVVREGGWVNDKDDRGGATNYGVSLRYAKGIGLDLDGDGDTDADDIRLVTPEIAVDLYVEDFFTEPRFDCLPAPLHSPMFDAAVNHGAPRALMFLQVVLSEVHRAVPGTVPHPGRSDGVMGTKTRRSAEAAMGELGPFLVNAYVDQRVAFFRSIVARDTSQKRFLDGWISRAEEFRLEVN